MGGLLLIIAQAGTTSSPVGLRHGDSGSERERQGVLCSWVCVGY